MHIACAGTPSRQPKPEVSAIAAPTAYSRPPAAEHLPAPYFLMFLTSDDDDHIHPSPLDLASSAGPTPRARLNALASLSGLQAKKTQNVTVSLHALREVLSMASIGAQGALASRDLAADVARRCFLRDEVVCFRWTRR